MFKGPKTVNKGAPSGLIVSLIFHGAIFFVAGLFVVFKVMNPPEPEFEAPTPIERPKMKLKKPKVKVKKSSQPKPSSRIVAKVKTRDMPEIQLPDLQGTGEGLLGGTGFGGEFLDLPEIGELSVFGSDVTTGNDLVGTFYDFKRRSSGAISPIVAGRAVPNEVDIIMHSFFQRDWDKRVLNKYYRAPRKLYASCICIGTVQSTLAPEAFGETQTDGYAWAVLYEGKLVYPEDIKFRFRGVGDKFMGVRVDGKVVLLAIYNNDVRDYFSDIWYGKAPEHRVYPMGEGKQDVGDWIELKGGVPVDIQIIMGDRQGGLVYHQLVVEVEGEEYPDNPYGGGPRLPVFKTDVLSRATIDALYVDVYPGDVNLTNGPVFCDYYPNPVKLAEEPVTSPPPPLLKNEVRKSRSWTSTDGKTLQASLLLSTTDYVLLETENGQRKIPLGQLSEADQRFLELANPPKFKIEFSKTSDQVPLTTLGPYDNNRPLAIFDWTFGVKMKASATVNYDFPLKIEYFAIGEEVRNGDNYILLERNSDTITPGSAKRFEHEFHGKTIRLRKYANRFGSPFRGRETSGYLITVSDVEGRIVQYETSNERLFDNIEKLKHLPVNAYFDKNCDHTFPTRPVDADRGPGAQL